jgi:hypothetical protein
MMYAQARNDVCLLLLYLPKRICYHMTPVDGEQSISGTRHYYTKQLCGYMDEKDPQAPSEKTQERAKQKPSKGKGPKT